MKVSNVIYAFLFLGFLMVGFEGGEFGAEEDEAGNGEGSAYNGRIGGSVPEPAED